VKRLHNMKRRNPSARYWDCTRCGKFLLCLREPQPKRIPHGVSLMTLGPCVDTKGGDL
jgi:hypothetical protein